jgi:hypothetical protein
MLFGKCIRGELKTNITIKKFVVKNLRVLKEVYTLPLAPAPVELVCGQPRRKFNAKATP